MLLLCRLFAHRSETLATDLAGRTAKCSSFGGADGASARSFVVSKTVPATAYLGGFSGSMFHAIKLIAGRVRVMS